MANVVVLISVLLAVAVIAGSLFRSNDVASDHIYSFEVVNEFPHDPDAYTQVLYDLIWPLFL